MKKFNKEQPIYVFHYLFVTIQPPSKRIPFLGVFVNDM